MSMNYNLDGAGNLLKETVYVSALYNNSHMSRSTRESYLPDALNAEHEGKDLGYEVNYWSMVLPAVVAI